MKRSLFAVLVLGSPLILGAPALAQQSPAEPPAPAQADVPTLQQAGQLVANSQFEEAATAYAKIVLAQPQNAQAWHMLGYSLHAQGDLDRAMRVHEKAATFPAVRPIALYNVACVHSLRGDVDAAFASLQESINSGFNNPNQFSGDADLNNLHGDPRWDKMMAQLTGQPQPAAAAAPAVSSKSKKMISLADMATDQQFNFWVGDWEVWMDGQQVSKWSVKSELGGKVIRQTGPGSMTVVNFEPTTQKWHMTWMSTQGHHDVLMGGVEGNKIVMMQPIVREQEGAIGRWILRDIASDSFASDWQLSMDNGKTWKNDSTMKYKRIGSVASAPKDASAKAASKEVAMKKLATAYDFTLGEFDMTFKAMRPDKSWVEGTGVMSAKRDDKGQIFESMNMVLSDGSKWDGVTKREMNTRDGNWALMWTSEGGPNIAATGKRTKDGSIVEYSSGSDEHGDYKDELHYEDISKSGFTIRLDRKYANMDSAIRGLFVAKLERR